MTGKPEQYYDTRRHQLYYQWRESEHYIHQEPIYDRTRDYIESLEAENAKLRAARDVWAENDAKLRELVRDVHTVHWNGLDCTECPWFDECDTTGGCPWLSILADHMRKLGVEVSE